MMAMTIDVARKSVKSTSSIEYLMKVALSEVMIRLTPSGSEG